MSARPKRNLVVFHGQYEPDMLLADLHVHTRRSDGWWQPERLAEAAIAHGLSAIAITDHDDIAAGHIVADVASRLGLDLDVLIGQEVSARVDSHDVHIIGLDLEREIRPWQSIPATIEAILDQGGIPMIPHPRSEGRGLPSFDQVLALDVPVAVEIYNASMLEPRRLVQRSLPGANIDARAFHVANQDRLLGAVGGTDAHFRTVGRGLTAYRGDIREAIRSGQTAVLMSGQLERLLPTDLIGYVRGLRALDRRRSARYGPRPR